MNLQKPSQIYLNGIKNTLKKSKMTLAIDMIGTNLGSGTKTYNTNFCEYLSKEKFNEKIYIFISKDYQKILTKHSNSKIEYVIKSKYLSNTFFRIVWMQFFLPFELKRLKVDKLYSPMNFGPIFLKLFKIKFILALHSNLPWVFFKKMPGNIVRNIFTRFIMEISISSCDSLIVDSHFAKKEIVKLLKIKEKKVSVIYLGIDKKYLGNNSKNYYLENFNYTNYFISVLSCVRYHNIINLLKAFKLFKINNSIDFRLVFVLQILDKKYFLEIKNFIENNFNQNEIIFLHNLDNKYLVNLYKKADLFIFSSYCEVFGLTSLEAMSQNCPIAISNQSALPEINSNAAHYFDPDNIAEIKESLEYLTKNKEYTEKLVLKANNHFKKFTWTKTVQETNRVLKIT
jgi:glycosyltransferase involved in cell wall biosynthesis